MVFDDNNPNFEIVYEEDGTTVGSLSDCKNFLTNIPGDLKVFHMNVCSINKKFNELLITFRDLPDFDCIVLTECHIKIDIPLDFYTINGYKTYRTENNKRKTDGIIVYIKTELEPLVKEIKLTDCNCL